MKFSQKFSDNKNLLYLILGLLLLVYLYLETPVPLNMIINDTLLTIISIVLIVVSYLLISKVNIFVGLLFIIIAFELLRKLIGNKPMPIDRLSVKTTETDLKINGANGLKKEYTLEESIVTTMNNSKNNHQEMDDPEYQPQLPDLTSTSDI